MDPSPPSSSALSSARTLAHHNLSLALTLLSTSIAHLRLTNQTNFVLAFNSHYHVLAAHLPLPQITVVHTLPPTVGETEAQRVRNRAIAETLARRAARLAWSEDFPGWREEARELREEVERFALFCEGWLWRENEGRSESSSSSDGSDF